MAELSTILASGDIEEIQLTTTGYLLKHSSGDADAGNFNISCGIYPDVNLPDTRANVVWGMGYNIANNGNSRENTDEPALNVVFESYYVQGGVTASEFHLDYYDTGGTSHRFLSASLPRNGGNGSILTFRSEIYNFFDFGGTQRIKLDLTNNTWDFPGAAITTRYRQNNVIVAQQRNAADSAYLSLPYINAADRYQISQGIQAVGSTPTTGTYPNIFAKLQATSLAAGGQVLGITVPAVTGTAYAMFAGGAVTGTLMMELRNTSAEAAAHSELLLRTAGAGGDPRIHLEANGATHWYIGLDNSASDQLAIGTGALGSADKMTLDTSGNAVLAGHITAVLPTADPAVSGRFWNDSGTVKVSAG